jgi:hypothetical protein
LQATLDKGLKMKIKRTKTGTKTSDSKHEIVKSEQNGNLNSEDATPNCKKPVNSTGGVPASPSSSANKRGNNSHRKDKGKDKSQTKDKPDIGPTTPETCTCGLDKLGSSLCTSASCLKLRESALPLRVATVQNQISLKYDLPFNYNRLNDDTGSCFSLEKQSSTGMNTAANAPTPPKEPVKVKKMNISWSNKFSPWNYFRYSHSQVE